MSFGNDTMTLEEMVRELGAEHGICPESDDCIARVDDPDESCIECWPRFPAEPCTHWMPLPELPKEKEGGIDGNQCI